MTFEQKLDRLAELGMLGSNDRAALVALIDAGSAAAHRGWKPSDKALSTMIHILETFIHKEIVLKPGVGSLISAIPPKPKRKKQG